MTTANTSSATPSTEFALRRTYALVSSEVVDLPEVFEISEAPHLDIKLNVQPREIKSRLGNHLVELTIVVTATHEKKTIFLVEVKQGGIFAVHGFDEATLAQIINIHCPALLYPYASALVSDLVMRASFMPLHLPPVDFNAMYEQQKHEQSEQASA